MINTMKQTTNWEVINGELVREFNFKDYTLVILFANKVMEIAQAQNHHPEITISYNKVIVAIHEHDTASISDKCHKLAETVNALDRH
jgi:4a-hydroxytetrahydrobiopterin dehydratase